MNQTITENADGTSRIDIDFADEGIDLQATTSVIGGEGKARGYAATFAEDIRRNNSHLFPIPEPVSENEEPI